MPDPTPARRRLADVIDLILATAEETPNGTQIVEALTGDHAGRVAVTLLAGDLRAEDIQARSVEAGRRVASWFEQVGTHLAEAARRASEEAAATVEQNETAERGGKETPGA